MLKKHVHACVLNKTTQTKTRNETKITTQRQRSHLDKTQSSLATFLQRTTRTDSREQKKQNTTKHNKTKCLPNISRDTTISAKKKKKNRKNNNKKQKHTAKTKFHKS